MSYQEKKALLNMMITFSVMIIYGYYVYNNNWNPSFSTEEELQFWAKTLLFVIPVQIVIHIVVHILFSIINTIAMKNNEFELKDEFDKIIDLKASRNSSTTFSLGVIGGFVVIYMGYGLTYFFISLIAAGMISEIVDGISRVYYYRQGV